MKDTIKNIVLRLRHTWYTAVRNVLKPAALPEQGTEQPCKTLPDMTKYDAYLLQSLSEMLASAPTKKLLDILSLTTILKADYESLRILRDYNISNVGPRLRLLSGYTGLCYDPLVMPTKEDSK